MTNLRILAAGGIGLLTGLSLDRFYLRNVKISNDKHQVMFNKRTIILLILEFHLYYLIDLVWLQNKLSSFMQWNKCTFFNCWEQEHTEHTSYITFQYLLLYIKVPIKWTHYFSIMISNKRGDKLNFNLVCIQEVQLMIFE